MSVYYQDEHVTLHLGDCLDVLPTLTTDGPTHLLTDPPYFGVKDDEWDNQWKKQAHFLDWMGEWMDATAPLLSADASVWVFASPQLASAVESVVAGRFRVLNSVRWIKRGASAANRNGPEALRRFLPQWEGIIFAEREDTDSHDMRREVFGSIGNYIRTERIRAGHLTASSLAEHLDGYKNHGSAAANVRNWEHGKNLISRRDYEAIQAAVGTDYLTRPYLEVLTEFQARQAQFEQRRRPFTLKGRERWSDVWDFDSVPRYPGRHPCEKPAPLLQHMIETTTRHGDTVLDCFAGSGSTLAVARALGRNSIGIEKDERYCEAIAERLSTRTLDLFGDVA